MPPCRLLASPSIGGRSSPPLCFIKLNVLQNLHSAKAWMTSTLTSIWTLSCPESLVVRVVHAHNTFLPAVVGWRSGEAQPEEFVEKTLSTLVRDVHIDCCVRVLVCPMGCPPRPCPFRHHFRVVATAGNSSHLWRSKTSRVERLRDSTLKLVAMIEITHGTPPKGCTSPSKIIFYQGQEQGHDRDKPHTPDSKCRP